MKIVNYLFAIFLLINSFNLHADAIKKQYTFNVHKRQYTLSTAFEIEYNGQQFAEVLKTKFRLRTHYDLYDGKGNLAGQGIYSWVPSYGLGWIYPWAADFYIYDARGEYLGMIDGTLYTEASAKFNFFDAENKCIAIAYMDTKKDSFIITDPDNSTRKIAELTRKSIKFQVDYWCVRVFDDEAIPPEMIKVFGVFACDQQERFKMDN